MIGQYLNSTRDKGLILKPNNKFNIECFVYSYFSGLFGYEYKDNSGNRYFVGNFSREVFPTGTAVGVLRDNFHNGSEISIGYRNKLGPSTPDITYKTNIWKEKQVC